MERRKFLAALGAAPVLATSRKINFPADAVKQNSTHLKISLNAYSFDKSLMNGNMSLEDLINFCAVQGFYAVDLTGYYFKGYPEVPSDEYIYHIKRTAFLKSVEIGGTGIRNDFTYENASKRKEDIILIKNWINVAEKLGAKFIRIFTGNQENREYSWDQVAKWMVRDIRECVEYGRSHGVIVAIQNHNDFIKTADQTLKLLDMINSEWCGLVLDTGSYRQGDPFTEIARTISRAVSWQIKEIIYPDQKGTKIDLLKLFRIIKTSGYRGYLPLETLEGDPLDRVPAFMREVRDALENTE